jgi:hypothetical protein
VDPDDEAAFERELRHILKGGPVAPQQAQPTADWVRRNCDVRVIAERLEQLYSRLLQTD